MRKVVVLSAMIAVLGTSAGIVSAAPGYYAGWAVGDARDGSGTILRSNNSGKTWTRQGEGQLPDVSMLGVVALDSQTAWVVGFTDGYAAIYHTTDGGETWVRKGSASDVPDVDLLKVSASDDDHVWAVGSGTILSTADGGGSWTNQIPAGYESVPLQAVSAADNNNVWVGGGPQGGYPTILKTTDGGNSWTRQSGGAIATPGYDHILGISAVNSNLAWAIGGDNTSAGWFILKTTDGGATWNLQTVGPHDGNEICAVDSSTVWGASDSTISWTNDGGTTWGSQLSYEYTMGICGVSSREAWAVSAGLRGSIWHTDDGGASWSIMTRLGGEELPPLWTVSFATSPLGGLILDSGDYDGDGTADVGIFRSSTGLWAIRGVTRTYFGTSSDIPVSGDYEGDGTAAIGVFRPSTGLWAVRGVTRDYHGSAGDVPVPLRFNGSSACNVAIYRGSTGLWAVRGGTRFYFGASTDRAVPGDYDGDGVAEGGIYRSSNGLWAIRGITRAYFGSSADTPVRLRVNPSSASTIGIFRDTTGLWAIRGITRAYFGSSGDSPVPADYEGSGEDGIGVFRESSGLWAIRGLTRIYFGSDADLPVTR